MLYNLGYELGRAFVDLVLFAYVLMPMLGGLVLLGWLALGRPVVR